MTQRIAPPERRTPRGTAAGVLDTISDAVTFVLQRPWLMIVPIAVDLLIWLFVRVSMRPIVDSMIRLIETSGADGYEDVVTGLRENADQVMVSDYIGVFVPSLFAGISVDTMLAILLMFVAPQGFGIPRTAMYEPWANGMVDTMIPSTAGTSMMIGLGAVLASSLALTLFRVPMARAIRATRPVSLGRELAVGWLRVLAYLFVLFILACMSIIPLAMLTMLAMLLGLNLDFVAAMALIVFGGMLGVYTLFALDAVLIHRTDPRTAFRLSYTVGKRYFAQIARFALTAILILYASGRLWIELAGSAPGLIVSIIGSAFIGTVLAAASMFFYTDRYRLVRIAEAGARNSRPLAQKP